MINNQNDTIKGYIDYNNWGVNPDRIHFKNAPDAEIQVFTPSSIKEFKLSDEKYYSVKVQIETSPSQSNLEKEAAFNLQTDIIFLQTLIEGTKSLYLYRSPVGKNNFYILQDGKFDLLLHKKYIIDNGHEVGIRENKRYVGQLSVYLNECEKSKLETERTKYTLRSLLNLFIRYYKCTDEQISFQKIEEKLAYEGGVFCGGSQTTLDINGPEEYDVPQLSPSWNMAYGISLDVLLPRNRRKWSIVNELNFPTYLATAKYLNYNQDTVQLEIGVGYIKLNNLVRYSYPVNDFRFFVNIGIGNGRIISERNYIKKTLKNPYFNKPSEGNFMVLRKNELSILAGAGARWNRWSLEYRAESGNGISNYLFVSTKTVRHYFLLSYKVFSPLATKKS